VKGVPAGSFRREEGCGIAARSQRPSRLACLAVVTGAVADRLVDRGREEEVE
jgi:hypothetical protein